MNDHYLAQKLVKLYSLLDDIDTLDDACKDDDAAFRRICRSVQRRRFDVLSEDALDEIERKYFPGEWSEWE